MVSLNKSTKVTNWSTGAILQEAQHPELVQNVQLMAAEKPPKFEFSLFVF